MDKFRIGVIGKYINAKELVEDFFGATKVRNRKGVWENGNIEFIHREADGCWNSAKLWGVIFVDKHDELTYEKFENIMMRLGWRMYQSDEQIQRYENLSNPF